MGLNGLNFNLNRPVRRNLTIKTMKPDTTWLDEPIYEYIKNNPNVDSVDIVSHFKLRADIPLSSLAHLIESGKVKRVCLDGGIKYGYRVI